MHDNVGTGWIFQVWKDVDGMLTWDPRIRSSGYRVVNAGIKGGHFRRFSRVPGEAGASDEHTKAQAAEV